MNKKIIIPFLCILSCTTSIHARNLKPALLRDGLLLHGVAGKLTGPDGNDTWFFEISSSISDKGYTIEAGSKLQLLPSSSLERMIENTKTHSSATYQLWNAKVTKYKGRNYLFASIFIPVYPPIINQNSSKNSAVGTVSEKTEIQNPDSAEPNDMLFLPPEVRVKLNAAQEEISKSGQRTTEGEVITIDTVQQEIEKIKRLNTDTVLLDNTAVFSLRDKSRFELVLDSIGQNINKTSFHLLPCEVLEQTQTKQAASSESMRFKISGIVTKYKGKDYLLLYKAVQIYSFGNFPG